MTTIRIEINVDNAAFEEAGGDEVARILRDLADEYEGSGFYVFKRLHDSNGNTVGEASHVEED